MHHRVRLFGIARPIVEDVAIGRIAAKKTGAGERPEKQRPMVEREGQRNRRRRRSDIADETEDPILVAKDLHGVGRPRRLIAVVRRHESQQAPVHASRVINLAEGGLDADLHLAAELPGRAAEGRRHPEHDLLVADAANGALRGGRLRRGQGGGIFRDNRRGVGDARPRRRRDRTRGFGVGDVRPWRRWGRTHGFVRSFRVGGRAIRNLPSGRGRNCLAQALQQTLKLRPQFLAAQLVREARGLVARGVAAQPRKAVRVTLADLIRTERRDFGPCGGTGRSRGLPHGFRVRGRQIRGLRRGRRGSRVTQALHETQELGSQVLAAQLFCEALSLVARGAAAQPRKAVPVAFADFIGGQSRDFRPWRRRGRSHGLAHSFRVRGRAIRDLRRGRRGNRSERREFRPGRRRSRT